MIAGKRERQREKEAKKEGVNEKYLLGGESVCACSGEGGQTRNCSCELRKDKGQIRVGWTYSAQKDCFAQVEARCFGCYSHQSNSQPLQKWQGMLVVRLHENMFACMYKRWDCKSTIHANS